MEQALLTSSDHRVLKLVQQDWGRSRQDLAEAAGMSPSTLWRRLTDLENSGAIKKRVALLDPTILGVPICVLISVNLVNYDAPTRQKFETFVQITPEIMECFSMTGGFDYMLIVRATTVMAFENFLMDKILGHSSVATASSQVSLRQHKYTTEIPV